MSNKYNLIVDKDKWKDKYINQMNSLQSEVCRNNDVIDGYDIEIECIDSKIETIKKKIKEIKSPINLFVKIRLVNNYNKEISDLKEERNFILSRKKYYEDRNKYLNNIINECKEKINDDEYSYKNRSYE